MSNDIVISFDTTGSMYPCLYEVRRKVTDLVNTLFNTLSDLRIGIMAHGDYCDDVRVVSELNLTNDKNQIISFVNCVKQTGGGDSDECYEFVLHRIYDYNWNADNRALIMIADADPHNVGYRYHGLVYNWDWREEARKLAVDKAVKIYPVQALNNAKSEAMYRGLAEISGTPHLKLSQFSDIVQLLTAVSYSQQSTNLVEEYATTLQNSGLFNRNLAKVFDQLIGGNRYSNTISKPITRSYGDTADLQEVDRSRFQVLHVDKDTPINEFVRNTGAVFNIGRGFYELTKLELIQERKEVVLRDKATGDMWSGNAARDLLGLPYGKRSTVRPLSNTFPYNVFVQSTSANRVLKKGTRFLYEA